jgi:hypothetical protein
MQQENTKVLKVQCLCEGTGFISQVDSVGDDVELVECSEHNPAFQDAPSVDELLSHLGKITGLDARL